MGSIYDYVKKYGDVSFKDKEFNVIDSMIFSAITYIDFTNIVGKDRINLSFALRNFLCTVSLKDYIINYSGMDVRYEDSWCLVPYKGLDEFVEKMKETDHFKWEAESSMEIRFMPSLARDINQYGFILDISSDEAKSLVKNDVNSESFDKKIAPYFGMFKPKDKDKIKKCTFAHRASYVIFGLNKCFIEGIVVGRNVEKDKDALNILITIIDSTNQTYVNETISKIKEKELAYKYSSEIEKIPLYKKGKGLPIGNMTSQIMAIFYLNELDHYIKEKLHIKYYLRYMDDGVLLSNDKEYLRYCFDKIKKIMI